MGHQAKDCSVTGVTLKENIKPEKKDVNSVFEEDQNFVRKLRYQFFNEKMQGEIECNLDTLLDTGSSVNFVKDNVVPSQLIESASAKDNRYGELNGSTLEVKGRVLVKLSLNNKEHKIVSLLIVPKTTMKASIVIGRDVLLKFYKKLDLSNINYDIEH